MTVYVWRSFLFSPLVSILIMLDTVLWPKEDLYKAIERFMFQSLLCWILYYDKSKPNRDILLISFQSLLCWILYYDTVSSLHPLAICVFQSLLCWILYYDLGFSLSITKSLSMFQSLLCWILYYDIVLDTPSEYIISPFQSLLCWILYYDFKTWALFLSISIGFNPYYVGYCTMTWYDVYVWCFRVVFQSLLCWILYYDLPKKQ